MESDGTDIFTEKSDLATITGDDNLSQAILLRLRTPIGTLPFHPTYGSRLHQMIGKGQSTENELVGELLVNETLMQEPRIGAVEDISIFYQDAYLYINIRVVSINSTQITDIRDKLRVKI